MVQGGAGATSVRVTRNGEPVPAELLGVPTPVNPGDYSYQALADGMESTATTVKLRDGVRETVVLTLRNIPGYVKPKSDRIERRRDGRGGRQRLAHEPAAERQRAERGGRPFLVGAIAGFGVAVAGGVVGTVFLGKSNETSNQADALFAKCNPNCSDEDRDDHQRLRRRCQPRNKASPSPVSSPAALASPRASPCSSSIKIAARPAAARVSHRCVGFNYVGVAGSF